MTRSAGRTHIESQSWSGHSTNNVTVGQRRDDLLLELIGANSSFGDGLTWATSLTW